jgi:hypothetical protein
MCGVDYSKKTLNVNVSDKLIVYVHFRATSGVQSVEFVISNELFVLVLVGHNERDPFLFFQHIQT